jgi:hypothetical protein
MKQGKTIQELAMELEDQRKTKRDFLVPSRELTLTEAGKLRFDTPNPEVPGAEENEFAVTPHCHSQLNDRLKIGKKYYDRLQKEHPDLLAFNVNTLLSRTDDTRMVRTLRGEARAFLSDRFRALDNCDLAEVALPAIRETDCQIKSCEVTPTRMYIKAVSQRITKEVKVGDPIQQGIVISNSEVGDGALRIESLIYRLICMNGMISGQAVRKAHLGRQNPIEQDMNRYLTDSTRRLDDVAFWAKTKDAISYMLSHDHLSKALEAAQKAADIPVDSPPQATIEVIASGFNLSDGEKDGVLQHLVSGGDLSAWGYVNAVTAMSQAIESYDRATEIERLGGQIVELEAPDWARIEKVAKGVRR